MRAANILALVTATIWGGMLCVGMDMLKGVSAQRVVGYPAPGQFDFFIGLPFAIAAAVGAIALLANLLQRFWIVSALASTAALAALLSYLFFYGGGV